MAEMSLSLFTHYTDLFADCIRVTQAYHSWFAPAMFGPWKSLHHNERWTRSEI